MGKFLPGVHRELHRVSVPGDVAAVELSIRGTFLGPFETPAGAIEPTGARLDIPTVGFWYVRDGKIREFNRRPGKVRGCSAAAHLWPRLRGAGGRSVFDDVPASRTTRTSRRGEGCSVLMPLHHNGRQPPSRSELTVGGSDDLGGEVPGQRAAHGSAAWFAQTRSSSASLPVFWPLTVGSCSSPLPSGLLARVTIAGLSGVCTPKREGP